MKIIDIVHVHHLKKHQDMKWHQRYHTHESNQYEFHYFLEGKGKLSIQKREDAYKKHQLFLVPPKVLHEIKSINSKLYPISYYAVLFELEAQDTDIKTHLDNPDFQNNFPFLVSYQNRHLFAMLLNQGMQSENIFLQKSAEYKLSSYIYELLSTTLTLSPEKENSDSQNTHIDKVISYMHRGIYDNISVATMALHVGISTEYLIRLFKATLGFTPLQYYTSIKIEKSCALLTNTSMHIQDISNKFNFSNAHNFTRNFIRNMGTSPTNYRKKYFKTSGISVK